MCATILEATGNLHRVEQIMGMPVIIDVLDQEVDPAALEQAFEWLRFVDETFSTYKRTSEICRLNRGELLLSEAHPDLQEVLERCEQLRVETDGFFDMRAPFRYGIRAVDTSQLAGAVDPSGYVKGWSVDRAAQLLAAAGARNFCIYAGGDIRLQGRHAPEPCWRIGIQHPYLPDKVAAVIQGTDLAIATSGAYERGQHIINPITGRIPTGVLSVTVTGPDLGTVDAYATAAFAMGEAGPAWTARLSGYEAMTILSDDRVLSTPHFPSE